MLHVALALSAFIAPAPRVPPACGMRQSVAPMMRQSSATPRKGSIKAARAELGKTPYGEESRQYRRTVYGHDDWMKHRSSTRLFKNLKGTFTSGVVRSLLTEVGVVTAFSLFIVLWNSAFFGYVDFANDVHAAPFGPAPGFLLLQLPPLPFTLSSPALGLLLVFRTNSSYQRWLEARLTWGRIVSHSRNILRQASVWLEADVPEDERDAVLAQLGLSTWVFCMALRLRLTPAAERPAVLQQLEDEMEPAAAASLRASANAPVRALRDLSDAIVRLPMDEKRKVEMDKSAILLGDACENCERIFTSPVPLVYTRHTARFLSAWLLLVPLALWESFGTSWNHIQLAPAMTLLAIFLFGIEELAVQLEEPFSILPLEGLCDGVKEVADDLRAHSP